MSALHQYLPQIVLLIIIVTVALISEHRDRRRADAARMVIMKLDLDKCRALNDIIVKKLCHLITTQQKFATLLSLFNTLRFHIDKLEGKPKHPNGANAYTRAFIADATKTLRESPKEEDMLRGMGKYLYNVAPQGGLEYIIAQMAQAYEHPPRHN